MTMELAICVLGVCSTLTAAIIKFVPRPQREQSGNGHYRDERFAKATDVAKLQAQYDEIIRRLSGIERKLEQHE